MQRFFILLATLFATATAAFAGSLNVDFNDGTFGPLVRSFGPNDNPAQQDPAYTVNATGGGATFVAPAGTATARMTGFLDLPTTGATPLSPISGEVSIQWTFTNVADLTALGGGSTAGVSIAGCYVRGGVNHWIGGTFGDYWFGFVRSGAQRVSVIRSGSTNLVSEVFTATGTVSYRLEKRDNAAGVNRVFRLYARYDDGAWHQVGADTNGDGAADLDTSVTIALNGATSGASYDVAVSHVRVLDTAGGAMNVRAENFLWEGPDVRTVVAPGDVEVARPTLGVAGGGVRTVMTGIAWRNSWRESGAGTRWNWDAVWVFAKWTDPSVVGDSWHHATLSPNAALYSIADEHGVAAQFTPVSDGRGVFVHRRADGAGDVDWDGVALPWDFAADGKSASAAVRVRVFAIPMVRVPTGAFYAGDGSVTSDGRFLAGGGGNFPYLVTAAAPLLSANTGGLWADRTLTLLPGGTNGPDPWENAAQGITLGAAFPSGYAPFYAMRYEITQGQYAAMLDTLAATQAAARAPALADFAVSNPVRNDRYRYTVPQTLGAYTACSPHFAANWLSWEDGIAYADWAALRPMTELEYEKAARGRGAALAGEFAWGTATIAPVRGFGGAPDGSGFETPTPANANTSYSPSTADRPLLGPYRTALFAGNATRELRGESWWGISDLSGNVVEMAVTPARALGRAFVAEHGDGSIAADGRADGVPTWPRVSAGVTGAFSTDFGFGFRGGDFYNPELDLRVSARNVATFGGARRLFGLGFRAVRSAPDGDAFVVGIVPAGGNVTLLWQGGLDRTLERSPDLSGWTPLPATVNADTFTDPLAPGGRMFYRLRQP